MLKGNFWNFKNTHNSLSSSACLELTESRHQHYKHIACFFLHTQACVVLKSVLSKAISRYRAKFMLEDAIGLRSHKSESEAVWNCNFM